MHSHNSLDRNESRIVLSPVDGRDPIAIDRTIVLFGRHPDCDVVIDYNSTISRKHCIVVRSSEKILICDLGSLNGVRVNGERIRIETELEHGDRIAIGGLSYRLEITSRVEPEQSEEESSEKTESPGWCSPERFGEGNDDNPIDGEASLAGPKSDDAFRAFVERSGEASGARHLCRISDQIEFH
jgi:pSer/pThr/pTyr-binding forkhead associated (FHA) protein